MRPSNPAALAVTVLLVAAPTAAAKEITGGRVCGADGCTATGRLGIEGLSLTPPGEDVPAAQPWYRIRLRMGEGKDVLHTYKVLWAPRERIIAYDETNPRWFAAPPVAVRIARRITRGVKPFSSGTMPMHLPPVQAGEVIGPVTSAASDKAVGDHGGAPWGPGGAAAAGVLVAGLGLRRYRSRRANARSASTPMPPT
jgi:hypothetical protein